MIAFWQFGLFGIVTVALVTDLRSRKIYNWLTFPAMGLGLALHLALGGVPGALSSLAGFAVAVLPFIIGFLIPGGQMAAGDVKLMAAVGLWLGWPYALTALVYVTILGAVIALVTTALKGSLPKLARNMKLFVFATLTPGMQPTAALMDSAAPPLPYGVSIAIGTALALLFPGMGGLLPFGGG